MFRIGIGEVKHLKLMVVYFCFSFFDIFPVKCGSGIEMLLHTKH